MQDHLNHNLSYQPSEDDVMCLPYPYGLHLVDSLHEILLNLASHAIKSFPLELVGQGPFHRKRPRGLQSVVTRGSADA